MLLLIDIVKVSDANDRRNVSHEKQWSQDGTLNFALIFVIVGFMHGGGAGGGVFRSAPRKK